MISQQLDKYRLDRCEILFTIPKMRRSDDLTADDSRENLKLLLLLLWGAWIGIWEESNFELVE